MPPRRKRAAGPARRSARFAEQDAANEKAEEHANRTYEIGDRVEARWDGRPEWFPGKVIAMNDDKTYDILYDDGDDELNVKPSLMKREGEPDPPTVDDKVKRRPRPKSPRPPHVEAQDSPSRTPPMKKRKNTRTGPTRSGIE